MNIKIAAVAKNIALTRRLLLLHILFKYSSTAMKKSKRRFWVQALNTPKARVLQGDYDNEMILTDPNKFQDHLRMSSQQFDMLLQIVGPHITKLHIKREPLPANLKLALTLRYLASGDSMISIARQFRVGESTTSKIIRDTCTQLWACLKDLVLPRPTPEMWRKTAETYSRKWNFPNCVAALDGKHVVIMAPPYSGSVFYNYKGSHSVVLMAMCDAEYNFVLVDIGAQGRLSDGGIFRNFIMGQEFQNNVINLPMPPIISEDRPALPYVVVADEAFPLTSYMMRPYPRKQLTPSRRIFNYRLSRARRCIYTFGILSGRWRIYRKPIIASLETIDSIIQATVVLHNFLKKEERGKPASERKYCPLNFVDSEENVILIPGEWRNITSNGLKDLKRTSTNYYTVTSGSIREEFTEYFISEGAVDFQWKHI